MRKWVENWAKSLILWFNKIYRRRLTDCIAMYSSAIFFESYIKTFKIFPENKLSVNLDLATCVRRWIVDNETDVVLDNVSQEQVKILYDSMINEETIRKIASKYFLLKAFYFSDNDFSGLLSNHAQAFLDQARLFDETARTLGPNDLDSLSKLIKKYVRESKNQIKALNAQRLTTEKVKVIEPFTVSSSHVIFLVTVFSTIFVISGFLYNKLFFSYFGISVSDFFTISDYLASSVEVIALTFISTTIGVFCYFLGVYSSLSKRLHAEMFELENQSSRSEKLVIPSLFVFSVVGFLVSYYKTNSFMFNFLYIPAAIVFFFLFYRLPIWKYVKNKLSVGVVIIVIFTFLLNLSISLANKIQRLNNGTYKSPYVITIKDRSISYIGYEFVSSNSEYVFMWNKRKSKMLVIPKSDVLDFITK